MKKIHKTEPIYTITVKDGGTSGELSDKDYYLDALYEFEKKLIDNINHVITITLDPVQKCSMIMFTSTDPIHKKRKSILPSKDELVHMAWEVEKDFDFKISCIVEVNPDD